MKILLVEDEELIGEMVRVNLDADGGEVAWVKDGESAIERLGRERFDVIVLDVMLPGTDGFSVARRLRKDGTGTPILMLTARGDTTSKVKGLEAGADDYLPKPFDMPELLARVRALVRRSQGSRELPTEARLRIGRAEINLETREARTARGVVRLSEKESALLEFLARHENEPVSRADILEEVWGLGVSPTERTIDNFILRLRKLFDDPGRPRHFLTVKGKGYRFVR